MSNKNKLKGVLLIEIIFFCLFILSGFYIGQTSIYKITAFIIKKSLSNFKKENQDDEVSLLLERSIFIITKKDDNTLILKLPKILLSIINPNKLINELKDMETLSSPTVNGDEDKTIEFKIKE